MLQKQQNRIAGSPRQRPILERLEPYEGKLSRTVLRGPEQATALAYPVLSNNITESMTAKELHEKIEPHRQEIARLPKKGDAYAVAYLIAVEQSARRGLHSAHHSA